MGYLVVGTMLIGVGVSLFRRAGLGVPPYDVLLSAIDRHSALSHGQAAWAVSALLLAVAALFGARPKVESLVYVLLAGVMVDASYALVGEPTSDVVRVVFVAAGVFAVTAGVAFVVHTTASGGAFEMLTRVATERGWNARIFRTSLEVAVFAVGALAGGRFGIATVIFALSIGPLLNLLLQALADHQLGRELRGEFDETTTAQVSGGGRTADLCDL